MTSPEHADWFARDLLQRGFQKTQVKNLSTFYFLRLTNDPVRENKKVDSFCTLMPACFTQALLLRLLFFFPPLSIRPCAQQRASPESNVWRPAWYFNFHCFAPRRTHLCKCLLSAVLPFSTMPRWDRPCTPYVSVDVRPPIHTPRQHWTHLHNASARDRRARTRTILRG